MSETLKVVPQLKTKVRVWNSLGQFTDYDATQLQVGASGDISVIQIKEAERRLNPQTGNWEQGYEQRLLAIIGPDGRLRAETVEVDESAEAERVTN